MTDQGVLTKIVGLARRIRLEANADWIALRNFDPATRAGMFGRWAEEWDQAMLETDLESMRDGFKACAFKEREAFGQEKYACRVIREIDLLIASVQDFRTSLNRMRLNEELNSATRKAVATAGTAERRANTQQELFFKGRGTFPPGTISWEEHLAAHAEYRRIFGSSQTAEEVDARGGFYPTELVGLLGRFPSTWVERET